MANENLVNAKRTKNDEFYTFYDDIEKEVSNYRDQLENKIVYCNCDNVKVSNFWQYFYNNFHELKLSKLIASHYNGNDHSQYTEYDGKEIKTHNLKDNGDFRSEEVVDLVKQSDIVITNPPFSLFREFTEILTNNNKDFLIIGNKNAIGLKNIFPLIRNNHIRIGYNSVSKFLQPDNTIKNFGNIGWFTTLEKQSSKELELTKTYSQAEYPMYHNYGAFDVKKVKDIPVDREIELVASEEQYQLLLETYGADLEIIEVIDNEV